MERSELKKQAKVIDMMITMHSILANRYARKAKILEIGMFTGSIVLLSTVFLDPSILRYFHLEPETTRIIIGLSSIIIFFLSILSLIVDWKGRSVQHRDGFSTLVGLKSEYREILSSDENDENNNYKEFAKRSSLITRQIIPIPDSNFNNLKSYHYRKIEISKMIRSNPGSSIYLLRLKLLLKNNFDIFLKKN